jgi:hypothetical protein
MCDVRADGSASSQATHAKKRLHCGSSRLPRPAGAELAQARVRVYEALVAGVIVWLARRRSVASYRPARQYSTNATALRSTPHGRPLVREGPSRSGVRSHAAVRPCRAGNGDLGGTRRCYGLRRDTEPDVT